MREARLARPQVRPAADDRRGRGAVVRRAERRRRRRAAASPSTSPATEWIRVTSSAAAGSSGGRIPGQPAREHRLPRAGRPAEEQVVAARGGELERAPGAFLAAHVGEVRRRSSGRAVRRERLLGLQLQLAAQVGGRLGEVPDRDRGDASESRLARGVGRTEEALEPRAAALPRRRRGRRRRGAAGRRARAPRPRPCARAHSAAAAATPRATRARSADRSRTPPCAALPARG